MRSTDYRPQFARPTGPDESRENAVEGLEPRTATASDPARWINVARVTNLAEAGFLVDELLGDGVDARIYQSEDFSALADRWLVSYLIQSSPDDAQAAAARIRQHLAEMETYQDPAADGWWEERAGHDAVDWRPVAFVILAGVAGFVLGQRFASDRVPPRPERNSLATAMTAIGRPLVSEPAAGGPRHRLYYHWRDKAWYLDADIDGDGRFESQQRFHAAGARW